MFDIMRFAIRDDDTNFYTSPEEISAVYSDYWDTIPPTLSVITHVKGNWKFWLSEMYSHRQKMDWQAWRKDDKVFEIGNNDRLINFLKEKLREGKIDVSIHAVHHRNEDTVLPKARENNYINGAEFYTSRDLTNFLRNGVNYLSALVGKPIMVFTPPQNLLSGKGYQAVVSNKLSVVGGGISFWRKEVTTVHGLRNFAKQFLYKITQPSEDYPFALYFKNHSEVIHHYPLHPTTQVQDLIKAFDFVKSKNGDFVLSTHYHEFDEPLTYNKSLTMRQVFKEFMNYVMESTDVHFCSLNEMCSGPNQSMRDE